MKCVILDWILHEKENSTIHVLKFTSGCGYLKNVLILRKYILKNLGVKSHNVCNLLPNGLQNQFIHVCMYAYAYLERKREEKKANKLSQNVNKRQIWVFLQLFCGFLDKNVFTVKMPFKKIGATQYKHINTVISKWFPASWTKWSPFLVTWPQHHQWPGPHTTTDVSTMNSQLSNGPTLITWPTTHKMIWRVQAQLAWCPLLVLRSLVDYRLQIKFICLTFKTL